MKFVKFVLVGAVNTAVTMVVMFVLRNQFHVGYWPASAAGFVVGGALSFWLNGHFTFQNNRSLWLSAMLFAGNLAACYTIAYSSAQPLAGHLLQWLGWRGGALQRDNIAMLIGTGVYMLLNYCGQKFVVFADRKEK